MTNPYAPPTSQAALVVDSRDAIKARVARPATALLVMASIHSVFVAIYLVTATLVVAFGGAEPQEFIGLIAGSLQFAGLILIAIGAAKLGFLESFRLARIASILACIPLVTPFVILGIPFGIWALWLLADPDVQAAFPDFRPQSSPADA